MTRLSSAGPNYMFSDLEVYPEPPVPPKMRSNNKEALLTFKFRGADFDMYSIHQLCQ
jgi:hypothetical protein